MKKPQVVFNGVDGVTGNYLAEPMSLDELAQVIKGEPINRDLIIQMKRTVANSAVPSFGLPFGIDPSDIKQAGWAIIFHTEESDDVRKALQPLIDHRKNQIGDATRTKILDYRRGEQWLEWLKRHGTTPGDVNPTIVPYYVLIVGNPTRIPFEFNYLFDIDYAVGRLSFDTADEYLRYAKSVVAYETNEQVPNDKTAVIFGTEHNGFPPDHATELSTKHLVKPLAGLPSRENGTTPLSVLDQKTVGFAKRVFTGDQATKANLSQVFRSPANTKPPAIVFTATHGIELPQDDPHQLATQGALLCQDWPRPKKMSSECFYAAADLPDDARVHGMITFHFACYGAGTPRQDNFPKKAGQPRKKLADKPFVAMLPKRLLTHPKGGALAVIGHVERAWGLSITGMDRNQQHVQPFSNTLGYLGTGMPVGYALKDFRDRAASLSMAVSQLLEQVRFGEQVSDADLALAWLGRNDARNYIILGDPAVHLRVEDMTKES
ncbi:hypothetical protein KFU94_60585 [Chloroflexi bacterium TSY]|nr:hypothetical protein [Chloroflexi bacterium TSY]